MAAGEAGVEFVPVGDGFFAEAPAEVDIAVIETGGEIDEAGFGVFQFDADEGEFVGVGDHLIQEVVASFEEFGGLWGIFAENVDPALDFG